MVKVWKVLGKVWKVLGKVWKVLGKVWTQISLKSTPSFSLLKNNNFLNELLHFWASVGRGSKMTTLGDVTSKPQVAKAWSKVCRLGVMSYR